MREWWSPAEIADAGLPDMPATKRRVNARVESEGWQRHAGRARPRAGREGGGGWEYHYTLFPSRAQAAIEAARLGARAADPASEQRDREDAWREYDALPETAKAKARSKLAAIDAFETLVSGGHTRAAAADMAGRIHGRSKKTIWNWLGEIDGVRRDDRLAYLVPRHRLAARKVEKADCDPDAWAWFLGHYLRLSRPSLTGSYRDTARVAEQNGWVWPSEQTIRRRLDREVDHATMVRRRDGLEALKQLYPPQRRTKDHLHALEAVNADGHKWDVFVRFPDGEVRRPIMVAWQDIYSGRILSFRIAKTENWWAVMESFGAMVEAFGVPDDAYLDNGRGFAAKANTGGAPTRFRFGINPEDPLGVMPLLGVRVHWTTPYNGRAKPIERAFRDLASDGAKDPRFEGAYCGNRPDARPEDCDPAKAVPLELFREVVAERIAEHNTRRGRRAAVTGGRSFVEAFEESYAAAPIRRATAEQRRMCLMGAVTLTARQPEGRIEFQGNRYWAPFLTGHIGKRIAVRFDPADLKAGVHIEALDGSYIGQAACIEDVGFDDIDGSKEYARLQRKWVKAEKAATSALQRATQIELSNALSSSGAPDDAPPAPSKVVRPVFRGRGGAAAAVAHAPEIDQDAAMDAYVRGIRVLHPNDD